MEYADALRYLDEHINAEKSPSIAAGRIDGLSLDPMRSLMAALGDPQTTYPVIHLSGTNGKGSVGAMVEVLLEEHGLSVGVYSSPHLQRVNERLRWTGEPLLGVDGEGEVVRREEPTGGGPIADEELARVLSELADVEVLAGASPSYFELLTAAAFTWFAELPVDVAVVEVGLLGRFDATNVADAQVAVITNIGQDHTDFVGDWRSRIAEEKVGIVKEGSFLVLGETDPDLLPIFQAGADDRLWVIGEDFEVEEQTPAFGGRLVAVRTPGGLLPEIFLPVHGEHQVTNAALAIAAVEAFFGRPLDADLVRHAFERLALPGRFEVVERSPLVVLDGAHNPDGAAALAATLDEEFDIGGRTIFVLGMLEGRDPDALLEAFDIRNADLVVTCTAPSPRGMPAALLAEIVDSLGVPSAAVPDVAEAVSQARTIANPDDAVIITGSMYVAGAARDALAPILGLGATGATRVEVDDAGVAFVGDAVVEDEDDEDGDGDGDALGGGRAPTVDADDLDAAFDRAFGLDDAVDDTDDDADDELDDSLDDADDDL